MPLRTVYDTIVSLILRLWRRVPEDARKKMVAAIVAELDELIREYFRSKSKQK